jgi:hypothetical protein
MSSKLGIDFRKAALRTVFTTLIAGVAIAEAVGARCTTYSGQALALRNSTMVCAPGELHATMLTMIRDHRRLHLYD